MKDTIGIILSTYPRKSNDWQVVVRLAAENVYSIEMATDKENRTSVSLCTFISRALDDVLVFSEFTRRRGPGAVVLSSRLEKIFCLGLEIVEASKAVDRYLESFYFKLLTKIRMYPLPIVCALHGYNYTSGVCLALSCDLRVQRDDNGYWCMLEADLGLGIPHAMLNTIKDRLPPSCFSKLILGMKISNSNTLNLNMVDYLVSNQFQRDAKIMTSQNVFKKESMNPEYLKAVEIAKPLAIKASNGIFLQIKQEIWTEFYAHYRNVQDEANHFQDKFEAFIADQISAKL